MHTTTTTLEAYDAGYEHGLTGRTDVDPTLLDERAAAAYLDGFDDGMQDAPAAAVRPGLSLVKGGV